MKKNKLSVVALVISLLPFITLLISLFTVRNYRWASNGIDSIKCNFNIIWV